MRRRGIWMAVTHTTGSRGAIGLTAGHQGGVPPQGDFTSGPAPLRAAGPLGEAVG